MPEVGVTKLNSLDCVHVDAMLGTTMSDYAHIYYPEDTMNEEVGPYARVWHIY